MENFFALNPTLHTWVDQAYLPAVRSSAAQASLNRSQPNQWIAEIERKCSKGQRTFKKSTSPLKLGPSEAKAATQWKLSVSRTKASGLLPFSFEAHQLILHSSAIITSVCVVLLGLYRVEEYKGYRRDVSISFTTF